MPFSYSYFIQVGVGYFTIMITKIYGDSLDYDDNEQHIISTKTIRAYYIWSFCKHNNLKYHTDYSKAKTLPHHVELNNMTVNTGNRRMGAMLIALILLLVSVFRIVFNMMTFIPLWLSFAFIIIGGLLIFKSKQLKITGELSYSEIEHDNNIRILRRMDYSNHQKFNPKYIPDITQDVIRIINANNFDYDDINDYKQLESLCKQQLAGKYSEEYMNEYLNDSIIALRPIDYEHYYVQLSDDAKMNPILVYMTPDGRIHTGVIAPVLGKDGAYSVAVYIMSDVYDEWNQYGNYMHKRDYLA